MSQPESSSYSRRAGWGVASLLAVLFFVPTTYALPHSASVLPLMLALALRPAQARLDARDLLLLLFVGLAYLNMLGMPVAAGGPAGGALALALMVVTVMAARVVDRRFVRVLLLLLVVEAMAVIVEAALGVPTLLPGHTAPVESGIFETDLLYGRRPLGLSDNSSGAAIKLLLGILMLAAWRPFRRAAPLITAVLTFGLVLTFNRTVMGAGVGFAGLCVLRRLFSDGLPPQRVLGIWLAGLAAAAALWVWGEPVYYQLTRGGSVDVGRLLTGRNLIWAEAWSFIHEHPWRGNHGFRFEVPWHMGWVHVHNSFLQMAANHGLLATPLVVWTLMHVGRRNWPYVVTIAVLAMGQYAIFWNFSFVDLIWVAFLKAAPWPSAVVAAEPAVLNGQQVEVQL